jgi:integrase
MLLPRLFTVTLSETHLIEKLFLKHFGEQMADVWILGTSTGLRIGELLQLRFSDLNVETLDLSIYSTKDRTQKKTSIHLSNETTDVILRIRRNHPTDTYVFQSRNSRRVINIKPKPISRQAVYKAFKDISDIVNKKLSPNVMRQLAAVRLMIETPPLEYTKNPKLVAEILKCNFQKSG